MNCVTSILSDRVARRTGWFVVNTHPHKEAFAIENLQRQGFGCYCPKLIKRVRIARRLQDSVRPMFPGYVFVEAADEARYWRPILSTYGVRTIVRGGDKPGILDPDFVNGLRSREIDGVVVKPDQPYAIGQNVCIVGGSFDGLIAEIVEMDDKHRLTLLLELLAQSVRVKIDQTRVSAVAPSS